MMLSNFWNYLKEIVREYCIIYSGETLKVTQHFIAKKEGLWFRSSTIYSEDICLWDNEVLIERLLLEREFFSSKNKGEQ